ncbi:coiled-coil domain-containing protein 115 isoform X2 [Hyalella azteca]|uniref:Vacuolar ATPase assembly protein VMA22 n=1 Tax=Hyalella azteca TaxID=294128 RepID=A0A8B7NGV3_HYAAZ|nr:coiled-coil domain-containing protein 115 isoform X2 [Hyalella azteca]
MDSEDHSISNSGGPSMSIDDDLDELALERLMLLDDLLQNKQMLAEFLRHGFFNLGKARYSLGCHAVSALRIPESFIRASTKTESYNERMNDDVSYVARRIVKNVSDCKSDKSEDAGLLDNCDDYANKKPINWFSALPPRSLRDAESQFNSALQLAAKCASLQEQLTALNDRYLVMTTQMKTQVQ